MGRHRAEVAKPFGGPVRLERQRREQQRGAAENADPRRIGGDGRESDVRFQDRQKAECRKQERRGDERSPLAQAGREDETGAEEHWKARR